MTCCMYAALRQLFFQIGIFMVMDEKNKEIFIFLSLKKKGVVTKYFWFLKTLTSLESR